MSDVGKLVTLDELKDQLDTATADMQTTEAAIFAASKEDDNSQTLRDLNEKFEAEVAEVKRLGQAVKRHEDMRVALKAAPIGGNGQGDGAPNIRVGSEPLTYRKGGPNSFFRDLLTGTKHGDIRAMSRLERHEREAKIELEKRDVNTGDMGGDSGGFFPPLFLVDEWAELARAGRVFANAVGSRPLPDVGQTFSIPRVTTGSTTAIQAAQEDAVSETDTVGDDVDVPVRTIAGQVDLSRQAFERGNPALDGVIAADLAAAYAVNLDTQLLNGTGSNGQIKGLLQDSGINAVTYTDASPTVAELYPKLADAVQKIETTRFLSPNAIFMHPRRWAWVLASLDSGGRPLVTPYSPMNAAGDFAQVIAEGIRGNMQGLPVYVDPNIPATGGGGTNEDAIIVSRLEDAILFEGGLRTRVFEETLSGTLQVRIQVYNYAAFTTERYSKAHCKIAGTGLASPSF